MKHILVHIDASPRSAERLALAQRLARAHDAALTALYAVIPYPQMVPFPGEPGVASVYTLLAELASQQRESARALFDRMRPAGEMNWAETGNELFDANVFEHALLADLLVLGQANPEDPLAGTLPPGFVDTLVVNSGKPALILPYAGRFEQIGQEVLLAWKPSREAARVAAAALPWLRQARHVHVACDDETRNAERVGRVALERWLRLQGVSAPITVHSLGELPVGEALLSLAADVSADLLAMGCYGHHRMREWVLGGATRTVLGAMTLPVLMAH